jgi:hypothetical protein
MDIGHDGRARQQSAESGARHWKTRQSTGLKQFQGMWGPVFSQDLRQDKRGSGQRFCEAANRPKEVM